jgi:hypothetical protein
MSLTVRMNNPALPDGEEVYIEGVGHIKNGGSATVSPEQLEAFETTNGYKLEDSLEASGEIFKVSKASKGGDSK